MKKILIALEILIILLVGGLIVFVYSGWYNIAATDRHYGVVKWVLETTMENSVSRHARNIQVPDLETFAQQEGLRHFDEMCVLCHGAPGIDPSEIGKGQNPEPPDLAKAVRKWNPAELFWIVGRGIKMTGMPGFGPTHAEDELWGIVAFIRRLPEISPEDYRLMVEQLPREDGHRHGPGEEHGGEPPPPADGPGAGTSGEGGHSH